VSGTNGKPVEIQTADQSKVIAYLRETGALPDVLLRDPQPVPIKNRLKDH
jgi:hypothetical protein